MDEKILKHAQYRKTLSISFFSSTNAAIEMVKVEQAKVQPVKKGKKVASVEERIEYWRNYFLDKHREYYSQTIANIGTNYDVKDTIERLKKTTDLESLKSVYVSLSADERHDPKIKKVAKELKEKYKNEKT